jgi:excisionase family DNA binding protein
MPARMTYTIPEVAEILGVSRATAYECVRRGEIPALTLGRRRVVPRAAVESLLASAANGASEEPTLRGDVGSRLSARHRADSWSESPSSASNASTVSVIRSN